MTPKETLKLMKDAIERHKDENDDFQVNVELMEAWHNCLNVSVERGAYLRQKVDILVDGLDELVDGSMSVREFWKMKSEIEAAMDIYDIGYHGD